MRAKHASRETSTEHPFVLPPPSRRGFRAARVTWLGLFLILGALLAPRAAFPIAGQWGVVFSIDAPWRLEPGTTARGGLTYGLIPIVISFRQAIDEMAREDGSVVRRVTGAGSDIWVGKVTEIQVVEWTADQPHPWQPVTTITPNQLREIERKRVLSTVQREPAHELCRPYLGEDCDNILFVTDTDEWHSMFWYTPQTPVTPGRNIHLEVTVTTVSGGNDRHQWTSYLVVHAGESPLPRFGDNWLYGDLHYHSQMTGNEGEYGHSYRNVARALGALGLDFAFTTDHASGGEQVLGKINTGRCGSLSGRLCTPLSGCRDEDKNMWCYGYSAVEARDLNASRFAAAKSILYQPGGANDAVARDAEFGFGRLRSANVLPQLYMGEEIDAQPEISAQEYNDGFLSYGDGLKYPWPDVLSCLSQGSNAQRVCRERYSRPYTPRDHRSYIVYDLQGSPVEESTADWLDSKVHNREIAGDVSSLLGIFKDVRDNEPISAPSRQHLVYFPPDTGPSAAGWVSSKTGIFGGASKHLEDVIREIEVNRGYTFLAHPLHNAGPGGYGPDVVPYSDRALDRAWSSAAVLGLQFWNETYTRYDGPSRLHPNLLSDFHSDYRLLAPFQQADYGNFPWKWPSADADGIPQDLYLYDGAYTWDRYLRKGLIPAETAQLAWLPKGEPRKWFMAGGSDAHGDLNYRQLGQICSGRWCVDGIKDTAIGRPRDLVLVSQPPAGKPAPDLPSAKRYSNTQVINALRSGTFSVTDGPAIRIAIDKNRNHKIDDADFQMGSTFDLYPGEQIPLLIEWISSPEWGPVAQVDLYVGTPAGTFAPPSHGPYIRPAEGRNVFYGSYQPDPSGVLQIKLADSYGSFSAPGSPSLDPSVRYHGLAEVFLSPQQFGITNADDLLFYVRAFAKTPPAFQAADLGLCAITETAGSSCGNRLAYSNPIWGRFKATCPERRSSKPILTSRAPRKPVLFLDADGDGVPDTCERDIPDPCIVQAIQRSTAPGTAAKTVSAQPARPRASVQKVAPPRSCQTLKAVKNPPNPRGSILDPIETETREEMPPHSSP